MAWEEPRQLPKEASPKAAYMLLVTGDIHLNANPRDAYRHVFMEETLPELIEKYGVIALLVLGDLTDEKDRHSAWLVNKVAGHFKRLAEQVGNVIIPRGNHDYTDPDHPFFAFMQHIADVHWINKPTEWHGSLILPHTSNWKRDWKILDDFHGDYIFAHQTFEGATGAGPSGRGIPLDIFQPGTDIISGDVHVPQTFTRGDDEGVAVTYVGAPYTVDFGDDYKPRVLLIDHKHNVKSIAVPGVQKRLLEVNSVTDLDRGAEGYRKGDILKVRVTLRAQDRARWPTVQGQVRDWGAKRGFQVYLVQPVITGGQGKAAARPRADARTDKELMATYGQAKAVSSVTLKVGLTLMDKT